MRAVIVLALGGALALLAARGARAAAPAGDQVDADPFTLPAFGAGLQPLQPADQAPAEPDQVDSEGPAWGIVSQWVESATVKAASMTTDNLQAFLSAIAWAEGTARAADPYRVCYGYRHTIRDLAEHPAVSGEWRGEPLDSLGPRYAGKVSTAAGRYQIIRPTWERARRALGLSDFGPASQDAAATWLIKQRGALPAIEAGDVERAAQLCAAEWASLPASTAGQPTRTLAAFEAAYTSAGGALA